MKTQKAYRILEALGKESLKLADKDRSERQFEVEYLTDAMGEFPWTFSKDRNEWVSWNKTVIPYLKSREISLIELAKSEGLSRYPYPIKHTTAGGKGNKATYEIISFEIEDSATSPLKGHIGMDRHNSEGEKENMAKINESDTLEIRVPRPSRRTISISLLSLSIIVGAGVYMRGGLSTVETKNTPTHNNMFATSSKTGDYVCDSKATCKEMTSCAEAQFYLKTCGLLSLDRDRDGVGCENLCK